MAMMQNASGPETSQPSNTEKLTLLGWIVLLLALYAWNHTKTGHTIIFYVLALTILYLFVRNYNLILPKLTKGDASH